jgi:hypothetical protein
MNWQPITRGKPQVRGVHPTYRGLLEVVVELDRRPPDGWAQCFDHPEGVGMSLSMHPPRLSGGTIYLMPPDGEVEQYMAHIDERIRAANTSYEQRILPQVRAAEVVKQQAADEEQRRLTEARRKLEGL